MVDPLNIAASPAGAATSLSPEDQLITVWLQARHTVAAMEAALDARLQAELGVPLARFALLCTLDDPGCAFNQQVIASLLGVNKSSVSRHVEAAARAGLVVAEVSAESRRDKTVRLTAAGQLVVERGSEIVASFAPALPRARVDEALETLAEFARLAEK